MKKISYHRAIWLYLRSNLSLRDIEDLLLEGGIAVFYETIRPWANHFGSLIAAEQTKAPHDLASGRGLYS